MRLVPEEMKLAWLHCLFGHGVETLERFAGVSESQVDVQCGRHTNPVRCTLIQQVLRTGHDDLGLLTTHGTGRYFLVIVNAKCFKPVQFVAETVNAGGEDVSDLALTALRERAGV